MSAVPEGDVAACAALPLLARADAARTLAWRGGRPVGTAEFLADVGAVAAALPSHADAINLCEDRYAFLVALCAVACRGRTNLLPSARTPQAIGEILAAHPGSYALGDVEPPAFDGRVVRLPPLGVHGGRHDIPVIAADQVVVIGYTSGSTGQPKPNAKTWGSFRASTALNVGAFAALPGLGGVDAQIVATVPPQHMYGIELSILLPLLGPFGVHAGRPLFPADVADALAAVPAPRVLVTTPVHLRALLREPLALPPLAAITSATAPLAQELAAEAEARYGAPVLELFGSTETCVIARRRCALGEDWHLYPEVALKPQPDGTLVDAPHFVAPVVLADLVELLPGHAFRLRGRHADLVEIAGKRASLGDLTRRVSALRGVEDAVVLQLEEPDATGVRRIAALVVAPTRCEADLLQELRSASDAAFLPRPLRKVAALPRNETGKLPRAELLAALRE
ncbi:MAG: AMP-binding protein [Dokdonella sp.]|uniref:AMP-binding protein n=1 Tax=Dokdonella sp. TaxID=2291710 RepID=UPI003F7E98BE